MSQPVEEQLVPGNNIVGVLSLSASLMVSKGEGPDALEVPEEEDQS